MTYYSSDCLLDNRHLLLPCALHFYYLHKFKPTVDEWIVQKKLLAFSNTDRKIVILYGLWNYRKNYYTAGNIVATPVAHIVNFSVPVIVHFLTTKILHSDTS
jgi:hypothetical protein